MATRPRYGDLLRRVRELEEELTRSRHAERQFRDLSWKVLEEREREREEVSRLIHDNIAQTLAALKLDVEGALRRARGKPHEDLRVSMSRPLKVLQNLIAESRRVYTMLRPSVLDDLGVLAAIRSFCREFQEGCGSIQMDDRIAIQEGEVPEDLKIVIYRVLEEASRNMAEHSRADLGEVSLRRVDGGIELAIKDNGQGFDLGGKVRHQELPKGLGLMVMKEQTELSGGAFAVESAVGTGTTVRAVWPSP